jgi:SAM-dependent methyltransferase
MKWNLGSYEDIAVQLYPAAETMVENLACFAAERMVDLGCGTGNAALLTATKGSLATGVDPSPRLLDVARSAAAVRRVEAAFRRDHADAIPFSDGSLDAVAFYRLLPSAGVRARGRVVLGTMHFSELKPLLCPEISYAAASELVAFASS